MKSSDYHDSHGLPIHKRQWMQSLKVGDYVCDCRYKHLSIVEIHEVRRVRFNRFWALFTYLGDFGGEIYFWLCETLSENKFLSKIFSYVADKDLTLEDGANCSAMHCCDPVDHKWNHEE